MSPLSNFSNSDISSCRSTASDKRHCDRYRSLSSSSYHLTASNNKHIEFFIREQEGRFGDEDYAEEGGEGDEECREGVGLGEDEVGEKTAENRGAEREGCRVGEGEVLQRVVDTVQSEETGCSYEQAPGQVR